MTQLKEIDGRYYQDCKVVMLATENIINNQIVYSTTNKDIYINEKIINHKYNIPRMIQVTGVIPQHLYITSSEEIKEGDWFYADEFSKPEQAKYFEGNLVNGFIKSECRKIIATTDKSLGLPKPSDSFISKYIEEYNKGNIITDVLVEYEAIMNYNPIYYTSDEILEKLESNNELRLKTDSNNTITIKKVKDSYSREEVSIYIKKYRKDFESFKKECYFGPNEKEIKYWTEQWIKENL